MDDLIPQEPSGEQASDAAPKSTQGERRTGQRQGAGQIFGETECLSGLSQIPGAIAMGFLRPAEANAMRATFVAILQNLKHGQSGPTNAATDNPELIEKLRQQPELLRVFASFLTDEQLKMILNDPSGDEQA
jgi:hypothetical protein